jgi:hypothetical protein
VGLLSKVEYCMRPYEGSGSASAASGRRGDG